MAVEVNQFQDLSGQDNSQRNSKVSWRNSFIFRNIFYHSWLKYQACSSYLNRVESFINVLEWELFKCFFWNINKTSNKNKQENFFRGRFCFKVITLHDNFWLKAILLPREIRKAKNIKIIISREQTTRELRETTDWTLIFSFICTEEFIVNKRED